MTESEQAFLHMFRDIYYEIIMLLKEKDLYKDTEFDQGYIAGLRSVMHLIHTQSVAFEVDLRDFSQSDFIISDWLSSPNDYVWKSKEE